MLLLQIRWLLEVNTNVAQSRSTRGTGQPAAGEKSDRSGRVETRTKNNTRQKHARESERAPSAHAGYIEATSACALYKKRRSFRGT